VVGLFAEKACQENMASGTASDIDSSAGGASVQHKWASWLETEKQAKETAARDGASEFVSAAEPKRPDSAKLWSHAVAGGIAAHSIKFFCGNPSVEKTEGIVHLYREE